MTDTLAIDPSLIPAGFLHWGASETYAGMAHFAGTGPDDKRCKHCANWLDGDNRRDQLTRKSAAPCRKFRQLTKKAGKPVPGGARSCKYFEEAP